MKIATTFTVRLAYRHYRSTRLVQFLVNAYMYVLIFLLQNATIAMVVDDVIYLFIFFSSFYFKVLRSKSHIV